MSYSAFDASIRRMLEGSSSSGGSCTPYNFSADSLNTGSMWNWEGWYTLAVLFILFVTLFFDWCPIEFAMVLASAMLCVAQIITVGEMTAGFANGGVLVVPCLFVIAEALSSTGGVDYFLGKLLGNPKTLGQALMRMMPPAAFCAAWISSTAVLALLIPVVQRWSRKIKQAPSQLFMPLCYAIHLGGTVTLIGTTTNLVIAGLASTYYCQHMGIFELSTVGLPVCIAGLGFLLLLTPKVLPDMAEYERRTSYTVTPESKKGKHGGIIHKLTCGCFKRCSKASQTAAEKGDVEEELQIVQGTGLVPNVTGFVFLATIPENSEMHEKSVEEVGLRQLDGLFLTSVQRNNTLYSAVGPEFNLRIGDTLSFAGVSANFLPMCKEKGLRPVIEGAATEETERDAAMSNPLESFTIEAVVRSDSDLIGKTMKEVNFRTRYNASALAIYRAGAELQNARLGQIPLKVGDVLLLVVSDKYDWNAVETKRDLKPRLQQSMNTVPTSEPFTFTRDYIFPMRVAESHKLHLVGTLQGMTLEQAGLRNIPGVRPIAVTRDGVTDRCIGPDFLLAANDILWFTGDRDGLSSLRRIPGLEDDDHAQVKKLNKAPQSRRLVEVVVSLQSDLLFKTVRESRFRTRFNAAIVAVQRHGQRVLSRIGDIELEPGDVLIIEAGPEFVKRFRSDPNFLLVSEIDSSSPPRLDRFYIATVTAIAMVVATAVTGIELVLFSIFACAIMLLTGVTTRERAHKSIDWKIIITVAAAFGLSTAMTETKVASIVGRAITDLAVKTNTGEFGVLAVVMIFTEILCALITAKAGALLMFPIAASAAARLNIEPTKILIALMLGASDYTTPQGHQTNIMVYGPGAYVFSDYQKLGIPLEIGLNIVQLICLGFRQYWYLTTIFSILFLLLCVVIDQVIVSRRSLSELLPSISCCRAVCFTRRNANSSSMPAKKSSNESMLEGNKSDLDPENPRSRDSPDSSAPPSGSMMLI